MYVCACSCVCIYVCFMCAFRLYFNVLHLCVIINDDSSGTDSNLAHLELGSVAMFESAGPVSRAYCSGLP